MKKKTGVLLAVVALILSACGKANYDDFVEVNTRYIEAMEEYADSLESAENAGAVAEAIENFAAKVEALAPEMRKLQDKYVAWRDRSKVPEELKPLAQKADDVIQQLPQTFKKIMQYMNDPQVMAAMEKLQAAMVKMR